MKWQENIKRRMEMLNIGYSDIADALNVPRQTIHYALNIARRRNDELYNKMKEFLDERADLVVDSFTEDGKHQTPGNTKDIDYLRKLLDEKDKIIAEKDERIKLLEKLLEKEQ